jgi:hypothetical protein
MSARVTLLAGMFLLGGGLAQASAACSGDIAEFEKIAGSDAATGNLNKSVYRRIVAELGPVKTHCAAGREAEATRGLAAVKSRHGYR